MAINRDKPTTTKPTTQAASPPVTFDVNDPAFQQIVAQAVAARLAAIEAEKPATMSVTGKTQKQVQNELQAVRAFKKLGITAKPHIDTFTFNIWVSKGYRPKEGSKSVRVNNLRLFHESQVRKLTAQDQKALKEQKSASEARKAKSAKVVPIGAGAPHQ
jgi:hypothetical protein